MIGSIRWNLVLGLITFICTFLFSFSSNIWTTTLLRSLYGFVTVFVLVFLFRWVLGTVVGLNQFHSEADASGEELTDDAGKGASLDVVTPDEEDSIHQMLKDNLDPNRVHEDAAFAPLSPPKLTKKTDLEPEDLAKALRQMSEE